LTPPSPAELDSLRLLVRSRLDSLRVLVRPPLDPDSRECAMPVAGMLPGIDLRAEVEARRVPGSMPIAPSACVNPLGR
jgi:hypothetical protein